MAPVSEPEPEDEDLDAGDADVFDFKLELDELGEMVGRETLDEIREES